MDFAKNVTPIRIQDEMKNSYLDYSMSVIVGRALPDVRDGLKPVHRRILYAMYKEGLHANKRYSKSAGVVGEVLKKYHPHGDSAVYDAMVRMAQPWNLRYTLVDGQGNFGSVDGDPAAAYRYTEARMAKVAEELLLDIEKETVAFSPNFDDTTEEPDVLPSRIPNLLVNGADGIAVGMATKIPPHNLGEIVDAAVALIDEPEIELGELIRMVPGPDFPTGGTIFGRKGVWDAYSTGRGRITLRGKTRIEEKNGQRAIIVDEIPYQVNKARLVEQIAELVKDKTIDGIRALRDESDRHGMRVVIELKKEAFPEVVLAHLYKHTPLQSTFGVILLSIVDQRPRILTLKEMLQHYLRHRRDVVLRRARFELRKAKERAHILEGFLRALDLIDAIITTIRESQSVAEARDNLIASYGFSEVQAVAILEMRLQRLTGMERQKLEEEYAELLARISELEDILASEARLMGVVRSELLEVRALYADPRRTNFEESEGEVDVYDLVRQEDQVVTLSRLGYIKRASPDQWRTQKRGGMGKMGMGTREEDLVTSLFVANTHSTLLVFSTDGQVFSLPVHRVPEAGRAAKGRPIVNLLEWPNNAHIAAVLPLRDDERATADDATEVKLLFVSRRGMVKSTPISAYKNLRTSGLRAVGVSDDDGLLVVLPVRSGDEELMILSRQGKVIRFSLEDVPVSGRTARGNHGIRLEDDDAVVSALLVARSSEAPLLEGEGESEFSDEETITEGDDAWTCSLLTVTALGFGKRTPFGAYRAQGRYGKGIIAHALSEESGTLVGAKIVCPSSQIMIVTDTGRVIRMKASDVRLTKGRSSKGVRLMRLEKNERIVDFAVLDESPEEE